MYFTYEGGMTYSPEIQFEHYTNSYSKKIISLTQYRTEFKEFTKKINIIQQFEGLTLEQAKETKEYKEYIKNKKRKDFNL